MAVKPHALAQLIDQVKSDQGWSDEDLAQRARRTGHQISKQRIADIRAQDPLPSIVPKTIRALAAAMELPVARVVEAALPAAGLPLGRPEDWTPETAIRLDPGLSLDAKRMMLGLLNDARGSTRRAASVRQLTPPQVGRKAARRRIDE